MNKKPYRLRQILGLLAFSILLLSGCATQEPVAQCELDLRAPLDRAMAAVEVKLADGCEYSFERYLSDLVELARDEPDAGNREAFSNFLVSVSDQSTISKRQAREIYNRYFNVKFVSLSGEYNTCSQVCPVRKKVFDDMSAELADKQVGLMEISNDAEAYYRADHLMKQSRLVLEATCRACSGSGI